MKVGMSVTSWPDTEKWEKLCHTKRAQQHRHASDLTAWTSLSHTVILKTGSRFLQLGYTKHKPTSLSLLLKTIKDL